MKKKKENVKDLWPLRTQRQYVLLEKDMETPKGVSMTVEDDSYTVKQLLEKFARGIDPMISKVPLELGDEDATLDDMDLNEVQRMDLVEREELLVSNETRISELKNILKKSKDQQTVPEVPSETLTTDDGPSGGSDVNKPSMRTKRSGVSKGLGTNDQRPVEVEGGQ